MKNHNSHLGIKISALPYKENEKIINLPLYNTLKIQLILTNKNVHSFLSSASPFALKKYVLDLCDSWLN